jgi:hypothetical protein
MALLFDYSGAVLLLGLLIYGLAKAWPAPWRVLLRHSSWYALGALGPVALLWFYQWRSFGHPFLPGQHWMPPVEWIDRGYQGYGPPQLELLLSLAFDYRYGFFASCPLMLLALSTPLVNRGPRRLLPRTEMVATLAIFAAFLLFFSGSNYTRLQFNTGVRYLSPMYAFLFLPAAAVLIHLPRRVIYFTGVLSVTQAWCLAMYRDVERGLGLLDPILHVFVGGLQLPFLSVLSRMGGQYGEFVGRGVSPLPLFALAAAVLYGIWAPHRQALPRPYTWEQKQ